MPDSTPHTSVAGRLHAASDLFAQAAELAAPRLEALVAESADLKRINEHHLTRALRTALEEIAPTAEGTPDVSPALTSRPLTERWPRLGNFDMSLAWSDGNTVYAELKCGVDEGTLEACAWDALKCSFALREGLGAGMLLVAAAPDELWAKPARGCELFDSADWDAADLRSRYVAGFTTWERDGYRPVRVPSVVRTSAGPRVPMAIGGAPWQIGIAAVEPVGNEWLDWVPFRQ